MMLRMIAILLAAWTLLACSARETGVDAAVLVYEETETGTAPYLVRITVTPDFLRIDDGENAGDYVLMDRKQQVLFGINHEERNILRIGRHDVQVAIPDDLVLTETHSEDPQTPLIEDRQPVDHRLLANDELCLEVTSVTDVMTGAVTAMREYLRLLASREQAGFDTLPDSLRSPCYLARFVFAPDRHLEYGLPVLEDDGKGYTRVLVDYRASIEMPDDLFIVPADYEQFTLDVN